MSYAPVPKVALLFWSSVDNDVEFWSDGNCSSMPSCLRSTLGLSEAYRLATDPVPLVRV